jgi:hypothetical protein
MQHGPVPIEVYENRDKPGYFSLVTFEPFKTRDGVGSIVKPKGTFNSDYFAEAELEEMNNLIEIFAQKWVGASAMSDSSHEAIKAWKKTWSRKPNAVIDPIEEFDRDIMSAPEETLNTGELRYLMHRKMAEITA